MPRGPVPALATKVGNSRESCRSTLTVGGSFEFFSHNRAGPVKSRLHGAQPMDTLSSDKSPLRAKSAPYGVLAVESYG